MADIPVSFASKEPIRVPVKARQNGIPVNPTALVVETAFTNGVDPSAWIASAWETDATTEPDTYFARTIVGGTGSGAAHALARGTYVGWVRVTVSGSERPVIRIENLLEID